MNSKVAKKLLGANVIAASLCLVLFGFLLIYYPNTGTMWSDREWATQQIQGAKTMDQMTTIFQRAIVQMNNSQNTRSSMFSIVLLALQFGFVLLCVNVYLLRRLYIELSKDDPAA